MLTRIFAVSIISWFLLTSCGQQQTPALIDIRPQATEVPLTPTGATIVPTGQYALSAGRLSLTGINTLVLSQEGNQLTLTGGDQITLRAEGYSGTLESYLAMRDGATFEGLPSTLSLESSPITIAGLSGTLRQERLVNAGFRAYTAYLLDQGMIIVAQIIPGGEGNDIARRENIQWFIEILNQGTIQ